MFFVLAYKDLQSREDTRNAAWQREGWDEVVYYTGRFYFAVESCWSFPYGNL